ncbi:uncharacterized protein ASCRUDRAFT_81884 [Ascoidea rubescens DSM 1968]|uniref:Uncharacterized protein n=1 Tax=Ascoidea rubescens DSM 1968 TaxID=1344418 RepID=A0A1D2VCZ9_9ASCO|nr:hypothetical protein ASCRUDRAFT_81884 [Ascoidea rubescens DSM 1968]ODV59574.1 hypothetical protein ASCRUDRAFT_81884 [Ascoidea rubescens DSM 1968]
METKAKVEQWAVSRTLSRLAEEADIKQQNTSLSLSPPLALAPLPGKSFAWCLPLPTQAT